MWFLYEAKSSYTIADTVWNSFFPISIIRKKTYSSCYPGNTTINKDYLWYLFVPHNTCRNIFLSKRIYILSALDALDLVRIPGVLLYFIQNNGPPESFLANFYYLYMKVELLGWHQWIFELIQRSLGADTESYRTFIFSMVICMSNFSYF